MSNTDQRHLTSFDIVDSIDQVKAEDWNRNVPPDFPFLRHEFLHALEESRCVSPGTGWTPKHIVIRNQEGIEPEVIGTVPLYLKEHSWGEFIFDWDWASSYQRHGLDYYPKLICQTPFTPITSPKLLTAANHATHETNIQLIELTRQIAARHEASSIHWHFISEADATILSHGDFVNRSSTIEYVWHNQNYQSMDEFLGTLSSRKRKKIRSERKFVRDRNIIVTALDGTELTQSHWGLIDWLYKQTVDKYHSHRYLSEDFFMQIGRTMPENFVFFLATIDRHPVAGSFCYKGDKTLYGRYWGSMGEFRNLHFEACYYAPMEYCIEHGLDTYNAGVQGEHKLNRGFVPNLARSGHSFSHPAFAAAIRNYIERESSYFQSYRTALDQHSPYAMK